MSEIVSFDLETHLIQPGRPAPTIVCGSYCTEEPGSEELLTADEVRRRAPEVLKAPRITGANIAYDFGVLATDGCVDIRDIFRAYDEGRVHDVLIAQALDAIAGGHLLKFPDGRDLTHPTKKKRAFRYSLELVTWLTTGRVDAKANDLFRTRYGILEQIPVSRWPAEAVQYPKDDVRNTMDVTLAQMGLAPRGDGRVEVFRNMHDLPNQVKAAWAMRLASMWGMRTDPKAVAELEAKVEAEHEKALKAFQSAGLFREDETQDKSELKRYVARAYGAREACVVCGGSGKVRSAKSGNKVICKASEVFDVTLDGKPAQVRGCDGTGFDLSKAPQVPRSEKDGVKTDRDALMESGDDVLEQFALVSENEKLRGTYIPFLKSGTRWPINVNPNVLVASGRTSYDGLIQLIPRGGGIRECFVAREGALLCSIDFEALELCTLAQVLLWLFGQCNMADRINSTGKPGLLHTALAARMAGVSFEEMKARVAAKEKFATGLRQASKAGGFGYPGGMSAVTLVLAKRKRSEGTTYAEDGTAYPGIRFCIYMRGAERCGIEKVTQVKDRHIPPTCKACIECAEELRSAWFAENPEMRRYFNFISNDVSVSGTLTQFVSERVRGGVGFSDGANSFFQGLAADGAKYALWNVTKEVYTDEDSPMFGARPVLFAHDEILSEIPEMIAPWAAPRMAKVMVDSMRVYVPDVTVAAAPALMRRWTKEADAAFDARGRLIPWEDRRE